MHRNDIILIVSVVVYLEVLYSMVWIIGIQIKDIHIYIFVSFIARHNTLSFIIGLFTFVKIFLRLFLFMT